MRQLLIEPHYLGSLEYFSLLADRKEVTLVIDSVFEKQTYLNRAHFLTANKIQKLTVPVSRTSGLLLKDAKIDYSHRWIKDHWGALYSGYGKAPFFDFFQDELHQIWFQKPKFLVDLNVKMLQALIGMSQLQVNLKVVEESEKNSPNDFRKQINPKKPFTDRKIYRPVAYTQLFGNTFVPNLSIVDLIMCEGPNTAKILSDSYLKS